MLWLSWPTEEAIAPRFMPKPWTKATRDIVVDAVPRDHRDLDDVLVEIDAALAVRRTATSTGTRSVMILPGMTPIACVDGPLPSRDEILRRRPAAP